MAATTGRVPTYEDDTCEWHPPPQQLITHTSYHTELMRISHYPRHPVEVGVY
jgi:hypothetical protein